MKRGGKAGAASGGGKQAGWERTPKLAGSDPKTHRVRLQCSQGSQELCSSRVPSMVCDPGCASCRNTANSIVMLGLPVGAGWLWGDELCRGAWAKLVEAPLVPQQQQLLLQLPTPLLK